MLFHRPGDPDAAGAMQPCHFPTQGTQYGRGGVGRLPPVAPKVARLQVLPPSHMQQTVDTVPGVG